MTPQKNKILNFLKTNNLMVLSTMNKNNTPQSALVAFAETENLELIFGTFATTRKYQNLKHNNHVSLVIGTDETTNLTLQYEGIASEVTGKDLEQCQNHQLQKNPTSQKYASHKDQRYFKINPLWIRYSDLSKNPEEIFEIKF